MALVWAELEIALKHPACNLSPGTGLQLFVLEDRAHPATENEIHLE